MRVALRLLAIAAAIAGCSIDNVKFTQGTADAPVADAPHDMSPDTPAGVMMIVASATTEMVTEGQTQHLMVSLSQPPTGALLVTIDNSDDAKLGVSPTALLFSTSDWNMPQQVALTGKPDADTTNEDVTVTLRSSSVTSSVIVDTTIVDDDALNLVLSSTTLDVGEGSTGSLAVHLSAIPSGSVTANIVSSNTMVATVSQSSLTFTPGNYATDQFVNVIGVQDADTTNNNATINFTSSTLPSASVTVQVTDDDVLGISLPVSSLQVTEGSNNFFNVALTQQPSADVTIDVMTSAPGVATIAPASLTFTTANWNVAQPVFVTGVQDVDTVDGTATVTLSSAGLASRTVAVTVTDDDRQAIVATPTTLAVAEGGTNTVAVHLAFKPLADVTVDVTTVNPLVATAGVAHLTFTAADYADDQNVAVSGVQDADAAANITTLHLDAAALGVSTDVTINVTDDDTLGIQPTTTALAVTEGSSAMFMVHLTAQPLAPLTVNINTSDSGAATVSPSALTFTTANWNMDQPVVVTGVQDTDLAPESVTLTLSSAGVTSATVTANVTDDDAQAIVATPTTVTVLEGGTTTFGVTLAFVPAGNVTVNVASMMTTVATVTPAMLTFTPANYNISQPVTVTGTQDADTAANQTTVSLTSTGVTTATVTVNVTDDDAINIDLSPTTQTVAEGGNGTLMVRLTAMPAASTTVTLMSSNTNAATLSSSMLTFSTSNWNVYQAVTIAGVQDANATDEAVTLTATATGVPTATAAVTVHDDDTLGISTSTPTVTLSEGGSAMFSVTLSAQPAANVMVAIGSSDPGAATVSPTSLTFTSANWNLAQNVTVTGVQDGDVANELVTLTLSAAGLSSVSVTANVTDDDTATIVASTPTLSVNEGGQAQFTVKLSAQPAGNVTVNVASQNGTVATVSPTSLTFTPSTFAMPQPVTVTGVQDADTMNNTTNVTLSASGFTSQSVAITEIDDDTLQIALSTTTLTITEGQTSDFIGVRLTAKPAANVVVNVATSDPGAATTDLTQLTFTTVNWSSFQYVKVSPVDDADSVNETVTITASSSGLTTQTATVTVIDDDVQGIITTPPPWAGINVVEGTAWPLSVHLLAQPPGNQIVNLVSNNGAAVRVSSSMLTFTPTNYMTDQLVMVNGVTDANFINESTTITLSTAGAPNVNLPVTAFDTDVQQAWTDAPTMYIPEGTTQTLKLRLTQKPPAGQPVTVRLMVGDPSVATVTPAQLTFDVTNWNLQQSVTVKTVPDSNFDEEETDITVSTGVGGDTLVHVAALEPDIIAPPAFVQASQGYVCQNAIGTLQVKLQGRPAQPVPVTTTVTMSGGAVAPRVLNFDSGNFGMQQNVMVNVDVNTGVLQVQTTAPGRTTRSASIQIRNSTIPPCDAF